MGRSTLPAAGDKPTLPAGAPRISLAAPADRPSAYFESCEPVTLIGSRRDCDLFISHDGVSKTHCALINNGRLFIAADLCTLSGTFVNGRRIAAARLHPGDALRVGPVSVKLEFLDAPETPAAPAGQADAWAELPCPLRLIGRGRDFALHALPGVIGRRHACHLVIDTPDVSLAHALLFAIEGCPAVCDLGSRSGTFVNGARVTLAWLRDGDRLGIGGEEFLVAWGGPQAPLVASAGAPARTGCGAPPVATTASQPAGSGKLEAVIAGLKADLGPSAPRERAADLDRREAELRASAAALERQRTQLAAERAELKRRLAECDVKARELAAREAELDRREAALAQAERAAQLPAAPAAIAPLDAGPPPDKQARPDPAGAAGSELPAPLVDQPLFPNLDPKAPDKWPREARERLRYLRRVSSKSDADVMAQVIAELRARERERRKASPS